jgi:hypothetical protein
MDDRLAFIDVVKADGLPVGIPAFDVRRVYELPDRAGARIEFWSGDPQTDSLVVKSTAAQVIQKIHQRRTEWLLAMAASRRISMSEPSDALRDALSELTDLAREFISS